MHIDCAIEILSDLLIDRNSRLKPPLALPQFSLCFPLCSPLPFLLVLFRARLVMRHIQLCGLVVGA